MILKPSNPLVLKRAMTERSFMISNACLISFISATPTSPISRSKISGVKLIPTASMIDWSDVRSREHHYAGRCLESQTKALSALLSTAGV
jgi:hypothetical protein